MSRSGTEVLCRTDSLTVGPVDLSDCAWVGRTQPTIITDNKMALEIIVLEFFTLTLLAVEVR